jgi:threonine dehydrogenase-like Zn-dependent dehydrogenase
MRALICTSPGIFDYRDIEEPRPEPGRTILRVRRIGVCGTDLHAFQGTQPYFTYPRILGHELAAERTDTGEAVTIIPYFNCGTCIACRTGKPNCCTRIQVCGVHTDGGMVEYLSVPDSSIIPGQGLSYDALALIEPLAIGAHGVRRAGVEEGEFVLVMGAGPIGLGTMAFARISGGRVIALDVNDQRLRFCQDELNVEHTVNARDEDRMDRILEITGGDMPTVVIDATGNREAINHGLDYLAHGGRYVLIGLQKGTLEFPHPEFHKRETTLMSSRNATRADFTHVMDAMEGGGVDPVTFITHRAPFGSVGSEFAGWLDPARGVIKAMIEL